MDISKKRLTTTMIYRKKYEEENKMADRMVKFLLGEVKEFDEAERTDVGLISTITPDRDMDIMLPAGCQLDNFRKNPVVQYAHNYQSLPIGKALWIKSTDNGLIAKTKYANTEFANDVWELKKEGFLNAYSVGFIPISYTDDKKEIEGIKAEYGIVGDVRRVIKEWELLEYSVCNVPANPEALTLMMKAVKSKAMKDMLDTMIEKSICGDSGLPIDEESSWDSENAAIRARRWASSDGSGDKDKVDFEKYKKVFVWRDDADKENFGAYKLPFADIKEGKPTAIWRGVVAAMAAVLGARGGVDIPEEDKKKAYNFLAGYYEKLDREVPEFHFFDEQWEAIEEMFDVKAGAVLNKKNKENLKQAQELIQSVLDSAEPIEEEAVLENSQEALAREEAVKKEEEAKKQKEEEFAREKEQKEKEEKEQKLFQEAIERLKKLQERTDYLTGKVS